MSWITKTDSSNQKQIGGTIFAIDASIFGTNLWLGMIMGEQVLIVVTQYFYLHLVQIYLVFLLSLVRLFIKKLFKLLRNTHLNACLVEH